MLILCQRIYFQVLGQLVKLYLVRAADYLVVTICYLISHLLNLVAQCSPCSCIWWTILCQLQMFIFRASDHQPYLNYSSVGYSIGYAAHVHDADLFICSFLAYWWLYCYASNCVHVFREILLGMKFISRYYFRLSFYLTGVLVCIYFGLAAFGGKPDLQYTCTASHGHDMYFMAQDLVIQISTCDS